MRHKGAILFVLFVVAAFFVALSQKIRPEFGPKGAVVGLDAPPFRIFDIDGKQYTNETTKGKTVIVHFWASWCKECQKEMPEIVNLYRRLKNRNDVIFLSVLYKDDPVRARKYLKDNNFNDLPIHADPSNKTALAFGVTGVPETYIIDPDGVLKKKVIGPARWRDFTL